MPTKPASRWPAAAALIGVTVSALWWALSRSPPPEPDTAVTPSTVQTRPAPPASYPPPRATTPVPAPQTDATPPTTPTTPVASSGQDNALPAAIAPPPTLTTHLSVPALTTSTLLLALGGIDERDRNDELRKIDPRLLRDGEPNAAARGGVRLAVEALAATGTDGLRRDLERLGLRNAAAAGALVSGLLPRARLRDAAALVSLRYLRPVDLLPPTGRPVPGGVPPRLPAALVSADAGLDGSGIGVGVIADSFDRLSGAAAGERLGELPGPNHPRGPLSAVDVLAELPSGYPLAGRDAGRAMLELIHDLAPGATLLFATGYGGQPTLAGHIRALAATPGVGIIVDGIVYPAAPWFQDGVAARAVADVSADGTIYVSAAGDAGNASYGAPFRPGPTQPLTVLDGAEPLGEYLLHDFDPGPAVNPFQPITLRGGDALDLWLQWDDPFASVCAGCPGASSELDIFLAAEDGNYASLIGGEALDSLLDEGESVLGLDAFDRVGRTPAGGVYDGSLGDPLTLYVVIGKRLRAPGDNPNPGYMQWIDFANGAQVQAFAAPAGTIIGHANAAAAISVGAAAQVRLDPGAARNPGPIQPYSGSGGVALRVDGRGRRIDDLNRDLRYKPELIAPDGLRTSFFSAAPVANGGGFYGSAAAAAYVAGVLALMHQASGYWLGPTEAKTIFIRTAADMDDPDTPRFDRGYDARSGYGLIKPAAAADAAARLPEHGLTRSD